MTTTFTDLALYAFALAVLVLTPGPVVVATVARTLASGMRSALPLAAGVAVCDMIWPLLAILGLAALVQVYSDIMVVLRYGGAAILIWMGWRLIAGADKVVDQTPDAALMRRTAIQGFMAGFLVNISNPKAIVFFIGILPTLVDVRALTVPDIAAILFLSAIIPFLGNVVWAWAAHGARGFLHSRGATRRLNQISGGALAAAGVTIAVTRI